MDSVTRCHQKEQLFGQDVSLLSMKVALGCPSFCLTNAARTVSGHVDEQLLKRYRFEAAVTLDVEELFHHLIAQRQAEQGSVRIVRAVVYQDTEALEVSMCG